ncbi:hypothetical protein NSQ91_07035 [Paenibacillus sp. FSL R7-0048]|jgi:prophage maintenance system killer protein|uniref:hypothetical protein n=1 Tax=Paenibacillus TaxID=44249 RepID=UPI00096E246F|nr:hypothetical protein [Paenibacillus odorifer]OMD59071.1 hypothetical protein BSK48_30275 [Paenibacillus odorifer]
MDSTKVRLIRVTGNIANAEINGGDGVVATVLKKTISYYDNKYDQISSITRSITQHAFENGNKRTALDTLNMLLKDFNLKSPLTDSQKSNLINNMAEGVIKDVSDISR